jgi:surfactin synthase thioesterase subunit
MSAGATLVRWTGPTRPASALVCVPWAGAGAAPFRSWVSLMPPATALLAARLPGRESRIAETPIDDMAQLVDLLASALEALGLDHVSLFGHCSGALIAFELARELRRRRTADVTKLFLASQPAPATLDVDPPARSSDLREALRRIGATPEAILDNDELFELTRPAIEADARLVRGYSYVPETTLTADIWVLSGDVATEGHDALEPWRQETSGHFARLVLPGGHMFLGESWVELGRLVAGLV